MYAHTIRSYGCGCTGLPGGPHHFEPCVKAGRIEGRLYDAENAVEMLTSAAADIAREPLTISDPLYFERGHSIDDNAEALEAAAARLRSTERSLAAHHRRQSRCRRAISEHLRAQIRAGAFTDRPVPLTDTEHAEG